MLLFTMEYLDNLIESVNSAQTRLALKVIEKRGKHYVREFNNPNIKPTIRKAALKRLKTLQRKIKIMERSFN